MKKLRIGEIAAQAGVRASAIRYYEAQGLLPEATREAGQRIYHADVFQRLALIELAKQAGFTIAEIKHLLHGFSQQAPANQRWRALAKVKAEELDQRIKQIRRMQAVLDILAACECPTLEDCTRLLSTA
ncbi:MerR family transcriptional regulator [Candidatus Entotheonella serta]|nr:MerR family transcriptional regulator [Candidatus Entotheonella serta]